MQQDVGKRMGEMASGCHPVTMLRENMEGDARECKEVQNGRQAASLEPLRDGLRRVVAI